MQVASVNYVNCNIFSDLDFDHLADVVFIEKPYKENLMIKHVGQQSAVLY